MEIEEMIIFREENHQKCKKILEKPKMKILKVNTDTIVMSICISLVF